jgi:hypothetical protein
MSKCPTCKQITDYGQPYMTKNGKVVVTKIECEPCIRKRIERKWRYSKAYRVTVLQKGMRGRRLQSTKEVPIWFTPEISILPKGNQDYFYVDVNEFSSELYWIKKGTKITLSFYWDEYKVLRLRHIGV